MDKGDREKLSKEEIINELEKNEYIDENIDDNPEEDSYTLDGDKGTSQNADKCDNKIGRITTEITNVNILKEQLAKLPLNPEQKVYYETEIIPIIGVLDALGRLSYNVGSSILDMTNVRLSKNSKIEDALKLVYDSNKSAREAYEVLKCRMDFLLYPERYK